MTSIFHQSLFFLSFLFHSLNLSTLGIFYNLLSYFKLKHQKTSNSRQQSRNPNIYLYKILKNITSRFVFQSETERRKKIYFPKTPPQNPFQAKFSNFPLANAPSDLRVASSHQM